ncbi:hypothetical protein OpiT1DRAFT_05204 [Opitutaceae bacterium TAV1]|nr:hypothetical protein OpiT1DRAFT_05204 [Opitutaceae bacterium TAV1]
MSKSRLPAILFSVSLCFCGENLAAATAPTASIPFLQKNVTLDGRIGSDEWDDAAVLHPAIALNQADAHAHATPFAPDVQTTVRLKYDDTYLYLAVTCDEDRSGYPEAYPRNHDGDFTRDDSVQVSLGLVESVTVEREILDMGGYPGAMGTAGVAADNYYQFTVNAAGARQRMWNERPLLAPRFESAVTRQAQDAAPWTVEYKIPFVSLGVDPVTLGKIVNRDIPLFFNFFRYRTPRLIGWHLPAYGGYRPMPFGQIHLLPPGAPATARSTESPASLAPRASASPGGSRVSRVAIGYYPLQGSVVGIIDGNLPPAASDAIRAVLRVSGFPDKEIPLAPEARLGSSSFRNRRLVILPIPAGGQPARKAEFSLYSSNSTKPVHTVVRELPAVTAPEWLGTDAGADYIDKKIPPPWTRPIVDAGSRTVRLVDKAIRFGAFGLPDSVILQESVAADLLAGSAQITLVADGRKIRFTPRPPSLAVEGNVVRVTAHADATTPTGVVTLETQARVDFDGFTEIKLRIRPAGTGAAAIPAERISRFAVRIPVNPAIALYAHRVLVQKITPLDGFGFSGPAGPLWTGNEQGGLAFSYDTPLFRSKDLRHQVRIIQKPDLPAWMEFNFIDAPGEFPAPGEGDIFRFFLQPTPTKPRPAESYRARVADHSRWEYWSDWQGYPDLAKIPELKKWADAVTASGRIPSLYTCQGLAENSPGFSEYREDFMQKPAWRFYRRHSNPGKDIDCFATNKSGPEGDLQLWAFHKLAHEAGISGTLSDGMSVAWSDDSPGNPYGGGRPIDISWEADTFIPSRITTQRTFLKRLRGIFHDTGRPLAMTAHTGGGLDPNTLSFFDYYLEGEQLSRFPVNYKIPLATYAIGYSGQSWGFRGIFWTKRWIRSNGAYRALTYALLHNNEIREAPLVQQILAEIEPAASDTPSSVFVPYWVADPRISSTTRTGDSRVSYYRTPGQALVVVGNTGLASDTVTVDLRRLFGNAGNSDAPVDRASDLLTGTVHALADGRATLDLPPGYCVVLHVVSARHAASNPVWRTANTLDGWIFSPGDTTATSGQLPDGRRAVILAAPPAGETRATWTTRPLTPSASGEFLIHPKDNFRLYLGDGSLTWTRDGGWGIEGFSVRTTANTSENSTIFRRGNLGTVFNPLLRTAEGDGRPRFASLKIGLRGNILDATLDDQPLAHGVQWGRPGTCGQPLQLAFSTRSGGELSFVPVSLASTTNPLYEGGFTSIRVAHAQPGAPFDLTDISPVCWSLREGRGVKASAATLDGKPALAIQSGRDRAIATLDQTVGDSFSAIFKFEKMPARLLLRIGPVMLKYDLRWVLDGPLNGWGNGVGPRTADKAVSPQPKIPKDASVVLRISMKDGVLDMVVNDKLLAREIAFDIPNHGNTLSVETWAKHSATFRLLKLGSTPSQIYSPITTEHPVL